jgi:hypothetical protein
MFERSGICGVESDRAMNVHVTERDVIPLMRGERFELYLSATKITDPSLINLPMNNEDVMSETVVRSQ